VPLNIVTTVLKLLIVKVNLPFDTVERKFILSPIPMSLVTTVGVLVVVAVLLLADAAGDPPPLGEPTVEISTWEDPEPDEVPDDTCLCVFRIDFTCREVSPLALSVLQEAKQSIVTASSTK
jgi:hypothetical protein